MKRVFYGFVVAIFAMPIFSCSSDSDSSSDEEFFNINAGNQWVYKRYNYDADIPGVYAFSGITDSVKVLDIVTLDGIQFSRVKHKLTNESNPSFLVENYEYLRINSDGKLVGIQGYESAEETASLMEINETTGSVFHPGNVENYQNTVQELWGTSLFYTNPLATLSIESHSYDVIPYFHKATQTGVVDREVEIDYEAQTGMVRAQCIGVYDGYGYEDRLVSHIVN